MSRKWALILAGVSLSLSLACAYLALPSPKVAGLVVTDPVKALGELGQGATVPVEFELVNRHAEPVDIVEVVKSCSCTGTELSQTSLAPGGRANLRVKWGTGAARGPFASEITLVYRRAGRAKNEFTTVRVEAKVIPDVDYKPQRLVFASGKRAKQLLAFSPGRVPKGAAVRASSTHRAFAATVRDGGSRVEVAFDPSQWPEESPQIEVVVETNSSNERFIKVPVSVVGRSEPASEGVDDVP